MKKKIRNPFVSQHLDPYEQELSDAIENGELQEVPNMEAEKKRIVAIFREAARKDRRVSLRVNEGDIRAIQAKAASNGLPYQTLIATLLHQFATGRVTVTL
ncbi:MAG: antitoxin [Candidatus Gottesmanbacteria bacterium]|nr:antitoxin [Candidatus Gottesmanbacteria bacterium]